MQNPRTKKYSDEGWKYYNSDGSTWPSDRWIPYSKKHPRPMTAQVQAERNPNLLVDRSIPPYGKPIDPAVVRNMVPIGQWNGQETGHMRYLAVVQLIRPIAEKGLPVSSDVGQRDIRQYMRNK